MDKAIAYEAEMRRACPSCLRPSEDVYDDDGEPHKPPLFEPAITRCALCQQVDGVRRKLADEAEKSKESLGGWMVGVRSFDPYRDYYGRAIIPGRGVVR